MFRRYILSYVKKYSYSRPFHLRNIFSLLQDNGTKIKCKIQSTRFLNTVKCNSFLFGISTVGSVRNDRNGSEEIQNNIDYLLERVNDALTKGDYKQAEKILEFSEGIAKQFNLRKSWEHICHQLVNVSIITNDLKKAETLLLNAVEQLNNWKYAPDSNSTVEFLLRLSQIYSVTDNDALASTGFDNILKKQKAKIAGGKIDERTGLLYIGVLLSYSAHLIKQEKYEDAKNYIDTAHQYMNCIPNLTLSHELALRDALADLNTDFGALKNAADHLVSAIVIAKLLHSANLTMYHNKLLDIFEIE